MDSLRPALAALLLLASAPALALEKFPAYLTVPPGVKHLNDGNMEVVDFGEYEFPLEGDRTERVQGKKFFNYVTVPAQVAGDWSDHTRIYGWVKQGLVQGGWKEVFTTGQGAGTFRLQKPGLDAWAHLSVNDETTTTLAVVERAGQAIRLTLSPPGPTPEKVADEADLPYLARYPGTSFTHADHYDSPLDVTADGAPEPAYAGSGYTGRFYATPPNLSAMQFLGVYEPALRQAGWEILARSNQGLTAHFTRSGRDVWAKLVWSGDDLRFYVADVGAALAADRMKAALDRDCHLALYGVNFDYNKATLKPEATPVLEKVLALLQQYADLQLELQGHTDSTGTRAYNQKLSESRVGTVRQWLLQRGIAQSRLTAHGYADTMPVAPNSTVEGRARNRRVELVKQGCKK